MVEPGTPPLPESPPPPGYENPASLPEQPPLLPSSVPTPAPAPAVASPALTDIKMGDITGMDGLLPPDSSPPPGYGRLTSPPGQVAVQQLQESASSINDIKMDDITEMSSLPPLESSPPAVYEKPTSPSRQLLAPPLEENTFSMTDIKMEECPETGSHPPRESSPPPGFEKPTSPEQPPALLPGEDAVTPAVTGSTPAPGLQPAEYEKKGSPAGKLLVPPLPTETIQSPILDVGQMVCGSCHELLCYPRGSIHVKCPCCQIVNFVLEEHQVGNVKCEKCSVLLIYPFGAPAVRCSCCHFVTKIGPHNLRPPLSVQQGRAPPMSTAVK